MPSDFSKKLSKLPPYVQDILISEYGLALEKEMFDKFELPSERRYLLGDIISALYFKDISLDELVDFLKEAFSLSRDRAKQLAAEIAGKRLWPVADYLDLDIANYLRQIDANPDDYRQYIQLTKAKVKEEKFGRSPVPPHKDSAPDLPPQIKPSPLDPKREKEESIELFSAYLDTILSLEGEEAREILQDYNHLLIDLLLDDNNFKSSLEKALYLNNEKITSAEFYLNNKKHLPTVGNWIKDFINQHGSGMFNNVVLSDYLINSKNAKKLNHQEKRKVQRLLLLYRNLRFFPQSMGDADPEQWEIFPLSVGPAEVVRPKETIGPPKTAEEEEIEKLQQLAKKYKVGSLERMAIMEEINKRRKIEDLKIKAQKLKEGSIEWKATQEEIKRLKSSS